MKKTLFLFLFALVAFSATGCSKQPQSSDQNLGAGYISRETVSGNAVTTSSLPTLIIPRNSGRQHAVIVNDGDEKIYIYTANFSSAELASTTVIRGEGIMLSPNGGAYEMDENNLKLTDVWVATTSDEQNITYVEN